MKLFFICFALAFTGVAQTPPKLITEHVADLMTKRVKWNSISRNTFSAVEKQVITRLIKDTSNAFCNDPVIEGDYYEDFHFIDLDGDKDLDIIYMGNECVNDYSTIIIYINNGMYKKVLYTYGTVADLKPLSDITIYKGPCCAMIENTVTNYRIRKDSLIENSGLHFFYSPILKPVSKDYDLILPKKLKAGSAYTVKANTVINVVPKDSLENPVFIRQSPSGFIHSETMVTSYASVTDKKGIQWLYCIVPKEAVVLNDNKPVEYPLLIWIKQRDCTKVN